MRQVYACNKLSLDGHITFCDKCINPPNFSQQICWPAERITILIEIKYQSAPQYIIAYATFRRKEKIVPDSYVISFYFALNINILKLVTREKNRIHLFITTKNNTSPNPWRSISIVFFVCCQFKTKIRLKWCWMLNYRIISVPFHRHHQVI